MIPILVQNAGCDPAQTASTIRRMNWLNETDKATGIRVTPKAANNQHLWPPAMPRTRLTVNQTDGLGCLFSAIIAPFYRKLKQENGIDFIVFYLILLITYTIFYNYNSISV